MICRCLKSPASSTGSLTVKSPGPELAEGRPAALIAFLSLRTWRLCGKSSYALNHSHREDAKSAKKHQTLLFLLCVLGVFAVKVLCFFFFRVFPCSSVANSYAFLTRIIQKKRPMERGPWA